MVFVLFQIVGHDTGAALANLVLISKAGKGEHSFALFGLFLRVGKQEGGPPTKN